jgi:sodium transport system ATP-binding protein
MALIQTHEISKTFFDRKRGAIQAVDWVSIQCCPGEIYGLLGPNGAGKTTLLRMLATILEPTSGTALVGGYDVRKEPERVRQCIGFLTGTAGLYERLLSTGQKQRVCIARAIVHDPPILFFDEPTSGLDVTAARTVVRFIRRCRDEGRTVVFSTHIMSEVEALCDRIAVIYQGKVAAVGTLAELRAQTGETAFERVFLQLIGESEDE